MLLVPQSRDHHLVLCRSSPLRNKWSRFAPPRFVPTTKDRARSLRYYQDLRLLLRHLRPCPSPDLRRRLAFRHRSRSPRFSSPHFPSCRPRRPRRSIVMSTAVHCNVHGCFRASPLRPSPNLEGLGCRLFVLSRLILVVHSHCDLTVRLKRLLPTPPHGDAVGTVFGGEQPNSTGGTLTRVDATSTGAPRFASWPTSWPLFFHP